MLVLASSSPRRRELLTQAGFSFEVHPANIPEDPLPNEDPTAYVTRLAREKAEAVFHQLTQDSTRSAEGSALCQGTASVVPQTHQMKPRALAPDGNPSDSPNLGAPSFSRSQGPHGPVFVRGVVERKGWESTNLDPQSLVVLGADTTVTLDKSILGKPTGPADAARMLRLLSGRTHRVITGVAVISAAHTQVASESTAVQFLALSDEEINAYIATGEPMDKAGAYAIQGRAARWIPRIEGDYFNVVGLPISLVSSLLESLPPPAS
jgi:septum formation protein